MSDQGDIPDDIWTVAHEIMITAGAEYFNEYYEPGEPGELYENGLVVSLAPHLARAILAERERCDDIARQTIVDARMGDIDTDLRSIGHVLSSRIRGES